MSQYADDLTTVIAASLSSEKLSLSSDSYTNFWKVMQNPELATQYVSALLLRLASGSGQGDIKSLLEDAKSGNIKMNSSKGKGKELNAEETEDQQSMVTTIAFLSLFYDLNYEDPLLVAIRKKWVETTEKNVVDVDYIEEVLRLLAPGFMGTKESTLAIMEQVSNMNNHEGMFETMPSMGSSSEARVASASLLFPFIQKVLVEGNGVEEYFNTALLLLQNQDVSKGRLVSLLHLVKEIVVRYPFFGTDKLRNALTTVRPFYLWPMPYGALAREVLEAIDDELSSPGISLFNRFDQIYPEFLTGTDYDEANRTVHVLIDKSSKFGKTFETVVANSKETCVEEDPKMLKAHILTSVLDANLFDPSAEGAVKPQYAIELLDDETLNTYYQNVHEILAKVVNLKWEDAAKVRAAELQPIADSIVEATASLKADDYVAPNFTASPVAPDVRFEFHEIIGERLKDCTDVGSNKLPKTSAYEQLESLFNSLPQASDDGSL
eukprot:TRINITY_DN220_c0_g2_i4.p1 TRINITY_DN220_c0_g2~~TRINITY_DN220_c0_g2_i4.p1  ORF type:complete len:500 (-),score=185.79 TRINITY_DN220_c0_g2_i4:1392-2870(-)